MGFDHSPGAVVAGVGVRCEVQPEGGHAVDAHGAESPVLVVEGQFVVVARPAHLASSSFNVSTRSITVTRFPGLQPHVGGAWRCGSNTLSVTPWLHLGQRNESFTPRPHRR